MARMEVNGLAGMSLTFAEMEALPDDVIDEMLFAEADVIAKAQRAKGKAYGVHKTGMTLESIKRSKGRPKRIDGSKAIFVYPHGKRGTRTAQKDSAKKTKKRYRAKEGQEKEITNAEVAFINEYGKKGQKARPFIRDANEEAGEEAVSAAEAIYKKWLKSL